MTKKDIELAEKFLSFHSPLVGGWQGDLMRRYLRYKKNRKPKQPFIPIYDTGFRSF